MYICAIFGCLILCQEYMYRKTTRLFWVQSMTVAKIRGQFFIAKYKIGSLNKLSDFGCVHCPLFQELL